MLARCKIISKGVFNVIDYSTETDTVAVMMTRATMEVVEVIAGDTMTAVMEGTTKAMVRVTTNLFGL